MGSRLNSQTKNLALKVDRKGSEEVERVKKKEKRRNVWKWKEEIDLHERIHEEQRAYC